MTRKSALLYLHAAHFLDHFFLLIFPTAVIAIERDWELTYGDALMLATPMYVAFALATLPAGWLGDHLRKKWLISAFFFGCGGASILIGIASDSNGLMVGLALVGLFAAIYHPVGLAMVTELAERRGRALAVNGVFGNMGLAGAALVTGFLAEHLGWRSAFVIPGLVSIMIGCLYVFQHSRKDIDLVATNLNRNEENPTTARATQIRVFAIVLVAALFGGMIFNTVTVSLPKLFDERLLESGVNLTEVGGYAALVFAVAAFAQLPVGDLLDRYGARSILIGLVAAEIGALILIANAQGIIVVPLAVVLVLVLFAGIPITSWLLGHYVDARWRARAFSVEYVLSLGMSAVVVPLIAFGHRIGYGFDVQYLILAASSGIVLVAAWFLPRWSRRSVKQRRQFGLVIAKD